ncbi:hypothetical protein [Burkholderia metallica]|uniref:hypothetical protein n=1 Tax=Burkholderia metallica TaxID=488729 RepID=UPI000841A052|nr:hypothetical protein [Burkholderia metallica]AOJ35783.1 hypothetical protein WJ16_30345 [Burkholderia metallica]
MANPQATAHVSRCEPPALANGGFLLVDPDAFSDVDMIAALNPTRCSPTNWGKDPAGLPAIVDLGRCDEWQIAWLAAVLDAEHANRKHTPLMAAGIGAYIDASASLDALVEHIAGLLLVLPVNRHGNRSPGGALWRFFDPRVFAHLCWMLDSDTLDELVGPVSSWSFPWLDGWFRFDVKVRHADENRQAPVVLFEARAGEFRRIDAAVWARAQRIASINRVVACLDNPEELDWPQRVAIASRIESALTAAEHRLHWRDRDDCVRYAEYAVRYGAAFLDHPKLVDCWARLETRAASMGWADVMALLTPDEHCALSGCVTDGDGVAPDRPFKNHFSFDGT